MAGKRHTPENGLSGLETAISRTLGPAECAELDIGAVSRRIDERESWYRHTFRQKPQVNWAKIGVATGNLKLIAALAERNGLSRPQAEEAIRFGLEHHARPATLRKVAIAALLRLYGIKSAQDAQKETLAFAAIRQTCKAISGAIRDNSSRGWAGLSVSRRPKQTTGEDAAPRSPTRPAQSRRRAAPAAPSVTD